MIQVLTAQSELCGLLQSSQISGRHMATTSSSIESGGQLTRGDIFSENLDLTLDLLEEEGGGGDESGSVKDMNNFEGCGKTNSSFSVTTLSSTNCSSVLSSADTSSIASRSSFGDYDIPFEESLTTITNKKNNMSPSSTFNVSTRPSHPHISQPHSQSRLKPDIQSRHNGRYGDTTSNILHAKPTSAYNPPYFFIDFENDRISAIEPPPHSQGMINSRLCYQSPLFPSSGHIAPPARVEPGHTKAPNTEYTKSLAGISEDALGENRETWRGFQTKGKKQRSKSSIGFASKKSSTSCLFSDSDASSCRTQSTVRSAHKSSKSSKNRNCANFMDISSPQAKPKRFNSNQSQVGAASLTDECGSVHSAFTDALGDCSRKSNWFSREKRKRIKKMLKMYEENGQTLNENDSTQNYRKVVLAEL